MNLPLFIAKRYLFSKKSFNAINIISLVSVCGVTVVTAALVVILSVFNGLEEVVVSLYNAFEPDIRIMPAEGKTIDAAEFPKTKVLEIPGVNAYCEVIEENALLKYKDKQYIARVKGVDSSFIRMTGIDTMMRRGELLLQDGETNFAVLGLGVEYYLSASLRDYINPIEIFVPKRGRKGSLNPAEAFTVKSIFPSGVFSIQMEYDQKYVLVPKRFAASLLGYENKISHVEISLKPAADNESVKSELKTLLGNSYTVKDRFEQHELFYKILKSEKWAVYLILTFILMIAIFNITGSLMMLILDKKKDIGILRNMGAETSLLQKIFVSEGMMISLSGAVAGLFLGFAVCAAQQYFGLVKLTGSGSFVVDAYPVKMHAPDFIYIFLTVFAIGFIASWLPVSSVLKKTKA